MSFRTKNEEESKKDFSIVPHFEMTKKDYLPQLLQEQLSQVHCLQSPFMQAAQPQVHSFLYFIIFVLKFI